jgi:outer membrane protein insertion porin family
MFFQSLKNIFIVILLSLITAKSVYADIINKITISGNERVNTETIKMFGGIKVGENLNSNDLNKILKNLYETNFFENVNISINESILLINVTENPIIQNLIINGIENKSLKKKIVENILLKEKNPFVESDIKVELQKLKNILQEVGYYFSSVDLLKKENNNNTLDLIFEIDLGDKAFINEIAFIGDKKFKKRKLLNVITSEENKFWKFISSKRLLNKQRVELDKRLLLNFYKNQGYYNASISDETVQYDKDQNFNIIFNITSGEKFYFGNFDIELPGDFEKKYFDKTAKQLNKYSGKKYSLKIVEKMLDEIEKIASSKQYEFINASIEEKIDKKSTIDVVIKILDDQPNIYVEKINIFGNNITIEDVVRNQFIIDEGDPFNKILFQKSINNVKATNIFKSVEADLDDTDDDFKKIINITVEEKPTGQISAGAGVGTSGASTSFGVQENNFLGKGIKLNSNLSLSEETIRGLFSYTKPNYNNSDRDLILSLQSQETDRLSNFGYKSSDTGFLIGTRFEHLEDFYVEPNFSVNYETLTTASTASTLLQKQEGDYLDVGLGYSLQLDKRDQLYQPSDGYVSTFYQAVPLNIEDNQTVINSYEIKNYYEYFDDLTASISIYTKAATSLGEDDVRISNRLYLPSRKLRGFESGKVGPIDGGDFVGGNYLASFNAASDIPIFESLETIDFNVFYDAANVWGVDYSSAINDSSALRSSMGLGVDWYTPIGPLSFSFSQPLSKKSTDKTETFRFNLGTTF